MAESLRIFTDLALQPETATLLREGVAPNTLVVAEEPIRSVLGASDCSLEGVHIAFGQPGVRQVLESSTLRWVHIASAGYTRYDTPEFWAAAEKRGLLFTNSSSVYAEPCAEQIFAYMLAQARQLPRSLDTRCKNGAPEWQALRHDCRLLRGQSVLILGFGAIARALVRMLAPFEMKITALRRHPRGDEPVSIIDEAGLPAALAEADNVINILPSSAATDGFMTAERFAQMKPGAVFYNMGRGTTVDQVALDRALRSEHLAAAWLDVTEPEPLPDEHPLRHLPNCFITPHVGGGHHNEYYSLVNHFLANYRRFVNGEPLLDRVL